MDAHGDAAEGLLGALETMDIAFDDEGNPRLQMIASPETAVAPPAEPDPSAPPASPTSPASRIAPNIPVTGPSSDGSRSNATTFAPRRYTSKACRPPPQPKSSTRSPGRTGNLRKSTVSTSAL